MKYVPEIFRIILGAGTLVYVPLNTDCNPGEEQPTRTSVIYNCTWTELTTY